MVVPRRRRDVSRMLAAIVALLFAAPPVFLRDTLANRTSSATPRTALIQAVADRANLLALTAAHADPGQFVVGERLYTREPHGLALAGRDDDFRLLVDRGLSRLFRSSEIVPILTRYFGAPEASVLSRLSMTALPEQVDREDGPATRRPAETET